jgi:hypothetical protein
VPASLENALIAAILAGGDIAGTPSPAWAIAGKLAAAIAFAFLLDWMKGPVFARFDSA